MQQLKEFKDYLDSIPVEYLKEYQLLHFRV